MERNICLSKLRQQRHFPLDWHTVVGSYYGKPIETLVQSMLHPRPSMRPTAAQIVQRIKDMMGELTILSPPPPPACKKMSTFDSCSDDVDDKNNYGNNNNNNNTKSNNSSSEDGNGDEEEDDDHNLTFLRIESKCKVNALRHVMSLILSIPEMKVDILQSGMAKQESTGTTILEFALKFQDKDDNDDENDNNGQHDDALFTTRKTVIQWSSPQPIVERLEEDSEIIRVQQISIHRYHHHPSSSSHHHHHHAPPPRPNP